MYRITLLLMLLTTVNMSAGNFFSVYCLTTEQAGNPIGIDSQSPRFSWKIYAQKRNFKQYAYQVCVADSEDRLTNGEANIWDSGKVLSEKSILIPFEGVKLKSSEVYYWKVRIWDDENKASAWSQINTFTTGLLEDSDWGNALWISMEKDRELVRGIHYQEKEALPAQKVGMYRLPQFRKQFSVKAKNISRAFAYVSGLGHFDFFLNGKKVGDHFLDAGWTLYDKEAFYVSFDITDQLQRGENVLGVMLGNGFYNVPQERYFKLLISYGAPKMRLHLRIVYDDNSVQEIISDKSWRVSESPVTFSSIYGGEDYDATREQPGWMDVGFDSSNWKDVLVSNYVPKMVSQQTEPIKQREEIPVVEYYKNEKGNWVYDLGQNFSGIIRLSIRGERGQSVRLIPAELLNRDHTVNQSASGEPFYFAYKLRGGQCIETWQPQFTYYGFRYVEVEDAVPAGEENPDKLPIITGLVGLQTCLATPETGSFSCSNPLFNKIHNLIDWAMRSNMASVLTDCPHREKLGWVEQAYLMQYSLQYRYNMSRMYNKIIRDMCLSQTEEGIIPSISPEYVRFKEGFEDTPEWGSAFIISSWYAYLWYGDDRALIEYYPAMKNYMNYLASRAKDHIISYGLGDWFDIGPDVPGNSQLTSNGVTATATYYYNAVIMQKIARLLDVSEDVETYKKLADSIKVAFNRIFFDSSSNIYDHNSQTTNAIVLFMDLVDEAHKPIVLGNLVRDIQNRNYALTAGDIGYRYVLRTLEANELSELIYKMNCRYDVPGYGWQLAHDATALTESWQAFGFVSNNHFMLGHLMEWLYSGIGGIRQAENSLGYKTVVITPQLVGDITSAVTSYESPYGMIRCEWKKGREKYELKVSIPANSEAIISLPAATFEDVADYGVDLTSVTSIIKMGTCQEGIKLKVGSGNYLFTVNNPVYKSTTSLDVSKVTNVLCLGNSITKHGVKRDIDWLSDWGMAASKEEYDYCHQLQSMLKQYNDLSTVTPLNIAYWEQNLNCNIDSLIGEECQNKDLIVIRLGENVRNKELFKTKILDLVEVCKKYASNIIITGCFWPDADKEEALISAASRSGAEYVPLAWISEQQGVYPEIGDILYSTSNKPYKVKQDFIITHPNDKGMRMIARRIFEAIDRK
ncbi:hypothetical protein BSGG_2137 [Bacteroides sp. D2]|nr:hypothetical protein BSGG_2137 [Bacteroides sp. D2]